ncbi:uncharacterized protein UMAG_05341 [Mycosarcoma maydis]|uniref:Secreted protein n=1 Tax=Mycosarcoma maydis TaxID=5270 RepID=A0A0D1DUU5_MYCMD|nr:uncharacterized protein UMAG_05341 [Ustilago maydis 521]KIS66340.1 hypothetical protein UMAG_05341 [Ustilago maydis 521]|eukprot:XP_011392044.1 hypothetical protein UMAG_05341 [Ustilago maydis 521]
MSLVTFACTLLSVSASILPHKCGSRAYRILRPTSRNDPFMVMIARALVTLRLRLRVPRNERLNVSADTHCASVRAPVDQLKKLAPACIERSDPLSPHAATAVCPKLG